MFKSTTTSKGPDGDSKVTRQVITEKVESTGGIETKTTTITCTKEGFDAAFKTLNLDPQKFQAGGTSVTKQIIYTNSLGQKEVIEETVETFEDSNKNKKPKDSSDSKSFLQKIGISKSNSKPNETATEKSVPIKSGKFEEDCLVAHNEYRVTHGVPKLTLSKEMCSYSKAWADHLAAADKMEHRSERKYGENIFMKWSSDPNHQVNGHEAVESWYSEIKDHIFGKEPKSLKSGHFTQVIWKESKKLGIAWARSKTGKILVVANYDPPGNFVGKFSENVPPVQKK